MKITLALSLAAATLSAVAPRAALAQAPVPTAGAAPASAPAPAGAKPAGKLRIGVAPSEAQLGQGNNAQGDYGAPIRNSIVLLMSGPAVDIVPLDSHLPMQLKAEAVQKECDYVLLSSVTVKRSDGGGFGKFMKKAAPVASMLPMAGMAAMAAAQTAQQQAVNQLAGFNGQIKSKDDVTVGYLLLGADQDKPRLQNTLNLKAKSDGEDLLTPLILKAADTILTEVTKK